MIPKGLRPAKSGEDARRKGYLGGKISGEVRRQKKVLRELLEIGLAIPDNGHRHSGQKQTNAMAACMSLINKAKEGDCRAFEVIRDTLGERPKERAQTPIQGTGVLTKEQRDAVIEAALCELKERGWEAN